MLNELQISGFRSLREFRIALARVTLVVGANGVGKTNLYRGIELLKHAACGRLTECVARSGGMDGLLWAGRRKIKEARRVAIRARFHDLAYSMEIGVPPPISEDERDPTMFRSDPLVKVEQIAPADAPRALLCDRDRASLQIRGDRGRMERHPLMLDEGESLLTQVRDPDRFPEAALLAQRFRDWRFHHEFRCDAEAPARRPQFAARTPSMSDDGSNLVSALRTIHEVGDAPRLHRHLSAVLPRWDWGYSGAEIWLTYVPGEFDRAFDLRDASDGTLRYLYLVAILLSPRPPELLVLNEPEGSLNQRLLEPLAELILSTPATTQVLVTTHSTELAKLVAGGDGAAVMKLRMDREGATVVGGEGAEQEQPS
ncbi:MAG: AAA family ATPase [Phycisphaerae bacterium]|nr:AAA family ATPase [Phycisphaerae bacterium]